MMYANLARNARSAQRTREEIKRRGFTMTGAKLWSEDEEKILRELYPDYKAICKRLPHRTHSACRYSCGQLKLTRPIHMWTAAEISLLRRVYTRGTKAEIAQAFPHLRWMQIKSIARWYDIHRARQPFLPTGIPIIDEIRSRCFELNYTMVDLDKLTHSRYFARQCWHNNGHLHHRAIGKAIKVLFGEIRARWKD